MSLRKIIRESINDFDWIDDINPIHDFLNKAFEFFPSATRGDEDYRFLTSKLVDLGFEPTYGTPLDIDYQDVIGLYAYQGLDGGYKFVFTPSNIESGEDYLDHIIDYAKSESIDGGKYLEVVSARKYVKTLKRNL